MSFLYNSVAPITVALVASVVAWLFGGARGDLLEPVMPWLLAMMVEVLLFFPQCHRGETVYAARDRAWRTMKRSWIFKISVVLLLVLSIPFVNNGLCPGCDAAKIAQGLSPEPAVPFLPFCVNRLDHLTTFFWFATAILSVLLVQFSMLPRGRRMTLSLIVVNGAVLSLLGFLQGMFDAEGPFWIPMAGSGGRTAGLFFSSFGYPNMAGCYFTLLFGLSVALWRDRYERLVAEREADGEQTPAVSGEPRRIEKLLADHWYLIPALLFFFSAVYTLSRAAIMLVTATATVYFLHTLVGILWKLPKARRVVVGAWSVVCFGILVFCANIFMPNDVRREVKSLDGLEVLDRVTGKGELHSKVATALWKEHPLFGCGGWGYSHFCPSTLKKLGLEPKALSYVGAANVHNDYLQFLAEHGLVVVGGLLLIVILLLAPVFVQWQEILASVRFNRLRVAPPKALFVVPSGVVILLVALTATFIHAFGDCPFRSLAVFDTFFIAIAAVSGFMPKRVEKEKKDPQPKHHRH